ncbi:hypothetical protein F511_13109 [Dorcoceras hygrometricum]|uniref:Uncharacterized protein n=1 Tax=Dorcoceras hygrometricum TaxID=472368 RepID=A0A2Z7AIG0_9LAMI|nr:hypothetical protein F511_13109 [Dorcoceras hygrometricum]
MRTRGDKRPSRKNDRKVLVAEESNKSWADNDLDSTSSSSSSSDSEQEEVHCLMADQILDDEVFNLSNIEFTREDLVSALNDMIKSTGSFLLRNESSQLKAENERLNEVMSSWTKSSVSLNKLQESQKPVNDKSGLGFNVSESNSGETSTQSQLVYEKFNKMRFFKASVIHDPCESIRYDDQISELLNKKGKAGIGYDRP